MSKSFTGAMKYYFGFKPQQTVGQFAAELKTFSYQEKQWFSENLQQHIPHEAPLPPTALV